MYLRTINSFLIAENIIRILYVPFLIYWIFGFYGGHSSTTSSGIMIIENIIVNQTIPCMEVTQWLEQKHIWQ